MFTNLLFILPIFNSKLNVELLECEIRMVNEFILRSVTLSLIFL